MTVTFVEQRFPVEVSMGTTGGPTRQTQIVTLGGGAEARNARWRNSRRVYDAGYGLKSMNDLHTVLTIFEAVNAQLIGFRVKDWADYKSCGPDSTVKPTDQAIGTGGVSPATYQLIKTYTFGTVSWVRNITKPVAGTVVIAFNGVKQNSGFTVDTTTGLVHFPGGVGGGVAITAGFEFDVPCRFDTDSISVNLAEFNAGKFVSIPIKELPSGS
jgi:uncharacterized protein (TIGR02217 family)